MSALHIADKAPAAIAFLEKTERRVNVTMPMILDSPAFRAPMADAEPECVCHSKNRNVFLDPRNVWL
jgi:hypothetical protein